MERNRDAHVALLASEFDLLCPRPSEYGLCDASDDGGILIGFPNDDIRLHVTPKDAAAKAVIYRSNGTSRQTFPGRWRTPQRAFVVDGSVNFASASALWFEIDVKADKHGPAPTVRGITEETPLGVSVNLKGQTLKFPSRLDAKLLRYVLPFEPSLVNCSGAGAHLVLCLDEILCFGSQDFGSLERYVRLQRDLRLYVQLRLAELGYASDAMNPLACVRVRGSWNRKPGRPPSAVYRLFQGERRFTLDEIEETISSALPMRRDLELPAALRSRRRREKGSGTRSGVFGELEPEKIQQLDFARDESGAKLLAKSGAGAPHHFFDLPPGEGQAGYARAEFERRFSLEAPLQLLGFLPIGGLGYARPGGVPKRDAYTFQRTGEGAGGYALQIAADGVRVGDGSLELAPGSTLGAFELAAIALYGPKDEMGFEKARSNFYAVLRRRGYGTALDRNAQRFEQARDAPPVPRATPSFRYESKDRDEGRRVVRERLAAHVPGNGQSLAIVAPPGLGKTIAAMDVCVEKLVSRAPGFEDGLAMVALPWLDLLPEKLVPATAMAERTNGRVCVQLVQGRQEEKERGFWCEDFEAMRRRDAAGHQGCSECSLATICRNESGRFLHDFSALRLEHRRRADETATLLIGTHAIAMVVMESAPWVNVVRDDHTPAPDGPMGVARTLRFEVQSLIEARASLDSWLESTCGVAAAEHAMHAWNEDQRAALEQALHQLEDDLREGPDCAAWGSTRAFAQRFGISDTDGRHRFDKWTTGGGDVGRLVAMMRTLAERKVRVPDVVVALIVRRMVAGAGELAERLAQVAGELPQPIKNELLAGRIKAPPRGENFASAWSWERPQDGEPLESVPAISDSLLELLRLQCENTPFGIDIAPRKQGGGYRAYVPNRTMLDALKRGKVISLSVEEPVFALLDALPIRFELFSFWPSTLRAIGIQVNRQDVVGTGGSVVTVDRLGAGKRVACSPKRERSKQARNQNVEVAPAGVSEPDAMFRRLVRELARLHVEGRSGYESMRGGPLGAVVHGADLLALEADSDTKWMIETEEGRSTIKFATYGANHASTDELSDCSLLIVRRWTLHPDEFERWTRIHLAIFPGEAPVKGSIDRIERWDGLPDDAPGILVHGPADPLTAACCSVFETYALLNAAGRSRGHATDQPRTVLVASGSPVWGLRLSELVDEKELFERFGARIDLVDADLRRGRVHGRARLRAIAKQKRKALLELIEREGMLSRRELAARLDVKERQVDRWLRKHRVSSRAGEPGYEAFVGEVLEDVADAWRSQIRQSFEQAHFQPHSNRVSIQMGPKLSLSGYGAVAVGEELERQGLRVPPRASLTRYLRTVRAALTGEDLELPSQERRRVECLLVAGALGALVLAEEAAQEEQPVRGKRRRGSA